MTEMSDQLPHFLAIGGMKCGSTSVYQDLQCHPGIGLAEKESSLLAQATVSDREIASRYASVFRRCRQKSLQGDVSTLYSMWPDVPDVARRARRLLGADARILYVVRHPIDRALSHHRHLVSLRDEHRVTGEFDQGIRENSRIVNYSRYATQLAPWREAFGDQAIHVMVFEEYVSDRIRSMREAFTFLGLRPEDAILPEEQHANASEGKPVAGAMLSAVRNAYVYQRLVRPWLPSGLRHRVLQRVLPKAVPRSGPPSDATLAWLRDQFADEVDALSQLLGRATPIWDLSTRQYIPHAPKGPEQISPGQSAVRRRRPERRPG